MSMIPSVLTVMGCPGFAFGSLFLLLGVKIQSATSLAQEQQKTMQKQGALSPQLLEAMSQHMQQHGLSEERQQFIKQYMMLISRLNPNMPFTQFQSSFLLLIKSQLEAQEQEANAAKEEHQDTGVGLGFASEPRPSELTPQFLSQRSAREKTTDSATLPDNIALPTTKGLHVSAFPQNPAGF